LISYNVVKTHLTNLNEETTQSLTFTYQKEIGLQLDPPF